jgi:hypothetical protein
MMCLNPIRNTVFTHTKKDLFQKPAVSSGLKEECPKDAENDPYLETSSQATKRIFRLATAIWHAPKMRE